MEVLGTIQLEIALKGKVSQEYQEIFRYSPLKE